MGNTAKLNNTLPLAVADDLKSIGAAVRAARVARGETQKALAARLGISKRTVSAVENGADNVNAGIVFTILWALGIGPMADILAKHAPHLLTQPAGQRVRGKRVDPDDF